MNREMVKEIRFNIDENNICTNDELNKSIIVQVDKGLLGDEKKITNELIEIGYNDLYMYLLSTLKDTIKYIKKVNLDKPFKQNMMGRFWGIELDADYVSPTVWLYTCLLSMVQILPFFDALFDKINEVEKEFSCMISDSDFEGITVFNKTSLLAQMEGLKQMKLSLISLYNCYRFVLKNPQIKEFFIKWLEYKKRLLCKIDYEKYNQEVTEYNELMISKINNL